MAKTEKYTVEQVTDAIREAKSFVSIAAKGLGCSQQTIRNYLSRYASVRQASNDAREEMKDFAENRLFKEISDGNVTAIIFYLKTQAKSRGYVERQEVTGADGGALVIDWDDED